MKFKLLFMFFVFTIFIDVNGLTSSEIESRNVCPNIELATANNDFSITSISCYDDYQTAKNEMDNNSLDDLIILERKNNKTRIIDAKYALVYLDVGDVVTNYYSNSNLNTSIGYMNHFYRYGATDGAFLKINYSNYSALVKCNGLTGWIKDGSYKIIPLNFLGNTSYYKVTNDDIIHYYSGNIETTYSQFSRSLGPKPNNIAVNNYYSYDGNYFYKDLKTMLKDYKSNITTSSINNSNPYYNYYMYLPHRSMSNYSTLDIDANLRSKGLIGTIYGNIFVSGYSNMYGSGSYFKSSERLYGSNAILMMSLATNESSLGQSKISREKNNLFGHAAYDSDAYNSATGYLDPYSSILAHAKSYINCGYANPNDYRYYGSHVGNKSSGMNVKYASDPYWGEKAANYYYLFDKENGMNDYNFYQLGIINYSDVTINVRMEPNTTSQIPYAIKTSNVPVIILGEEKGDYYDGSNIWYKIVSDINLNSNRTGVQECSYTNYYNWDSYVYIHSSLVTKINDNSEYNNYSNVKDSIDKDYTYKHFSNGSVYEPITGLINKDSIIYHNSSLITSTNEIIKKGHIVTIFMEAKNKNNKTVAYLVTTDYSKNQKYWIDANNVDIVVKDILKVKLNTFGDFINVYDDYQNVYGTLYNNTFSVIVDTKTIDDNLWLKIHYGVNNTYAWVNTNIDTNKGSLEYTLDNMNKVPEIIANDIEIMRYSTFDPLLNIKAFDSEDGDLTKDIKILKNNVDINKAGIYNITYQVKDSKEQIVSKTIKVTVKDYQLGESLFIFNSLNYVSDNVFTFSGFLGVKGMDNIDLEHYIIFVNQNDNTTYRFKASKFIDYPYEMSSMDDDKAYNYSGGWFKENIDLSSLNIKQGDYTIYVECLNKDKEYYSKTYFTNIGYLDMARRVNTNNRGFYFEVDYSYSGSPILLSIRDSKLLSDDIPPTMDPMYNFFNEIKFDNNNMTILGTSHNVSVDYSLKTEVLREIVFENIETFKRYSYNIGSIDNGLYKVSLNVSDNMDKTRAWYHNTFDISSLESGTYAIYIKTTTNNQSYYGELIDVGYTDFSKINTSKYQLKRNDQKRVRLELIVS